MSPNLILLEGPDCSGKTTLAHALCKELQAHYIHSSYTEGMDMLAYHKKQIDTAIEYLQDGPVVLDRLHPSEMVYGQVFRNNVFGEQITCENPWGTKYLELHNDLHAAGAVHIYCIPSKLNDSLERYAQNIDEDHPFGASKWKEIYMLYNSLYIHMYTSHPSTPLFHYDIDTHGKDTSSFIRNFIRNLNY